MEDPVVTFVVPELVAGARTIGISQDANPILERAIVGIWVKGVIATIKVIDERPRKIGLIEQMRGKKYQDEVDHRERQDRDRR